jgi:hypothetical protein
MSSRPAFNFPAFDEAAANLRARGYEVVSPAELDSPEHRKAALASEDGNPSAYNSATGDTWGSLLARDVKLIADGGIEAIVCLRGWERSRGARLETFVGRLAGLPILAYESDTYHLSAVPFGELAVAHNIRFGYDDDFTVEDPGPVAAFESSLDAWDAVEHLASEVKFPIDGEVRITDPKTGGQKGQKLAQLGALDPLALLEVAKVAGFGASKYERFNYAKGYAWSLSLDALLRHLLLWAAGEETDEESGLSHLGHSAWHCLALLTFVLRERGTDDRLHRTLEAA